jgi:hypothetical protein
VDASIQSRNRSPWHDRIDQRISIQTLLAIRKDKDGGCVYMMVRVYDAKPVSRP